MSEHISPTHPSPLDVHTVLSATLLRQGVYRGAGHRTQLVGRTPEGSPLQYALHDHYAWESTRYSTQPPVPSQNAHRRLLEQGATILALKTLNRTVEEGERSYTICHPEYVHPEYAVGGLFYEIDGIPPLLVDTPTDPGQIAIVASDEQASSHHYITDPSQEQQLMAAYTAAIQQKHPFNAHRQPTPRGTLSLEEQYASACNLGNELSVRVSYRRGQPAVLRAIEKNAYQLGFGLPQHLEHLSTLSKLGISVPSFRYQVGKRAIFAEVDYIEPVYGDTEEALAQPQALQAAAKLPGIISLYQNWSLQQEKRWVLDDIHTMHQYTYGVNCAIPGTQEPQWWLTDIEPLSDNRQVNLEKYIGSFYAEVSKAQSKLKRLTTECPPLF